MHMVACWCLLPMPAHNPRPVDVQEVTGTILALDSATGMLAIKQSGSHGGVNNLRLVKTDFVKVWRVYPHPPRSMHD